MVNVSTFQKSLLDCFNARLIKVVNAISVIFMVFSVFLRTSQTGDDVISNLFDMMSSFTFYVAEDFLINFNSEVEKNGKKQKYAINPLNSRFKNYGRFNSNLLDFLFEFETLFEFIPLGTDFERLWLGINDQFIF